MFVLKSHKEGVKVKEIIAGLLLLLAVLWMERRAEKRHKLLVSSVADWYGRQESQDKAV